MALPLPRHLPNLNGIRFIAAITVVLAHVEVYRAAMGYPHLTSLMGVFAGFGVDIFFALSGFLITYLLIVEKQRNGRVHIGHFYMRRLLRIWPLYFLILAIGTLLEVTASGSSPLIARFNPDAFGYYMLFIPQVGKGFYLGSLCVVILWSIGVEELFYLLYPWIFRKLTCRPMLSLGVIISTILALKIISIYMLFKFAGDHQSDGWIKTLAMTRFENLLVGAFCAFGALHWRTWLQRANWVALVAISALGLLFTLSAFKVNFYVLESIGPILSMVMSPFLVSALVGVILGCLVFNPRYATMLENPLLNYLGKISFGLYVYHCLALTFLSMLPSSLAPSSWGSIFSTTVILTMSLAALSYRYFEKPFLDRSSVYRHI